MSEDEKDLEQLRKAHEKLDEEIERKQKEILRLKEQRGEIGRKIDRLEGKA